MKKIIFSILFMLLLISSSFAQRIVINENFETTGFNTDSLPPNWVKVSVDPEFGPGKQWAVRDSGTRYVGASAVVVAKAHSGKRSLTIPWTAGNPIADDWTFTDTFTVRTSDSLIFWMLIGSTPGIVAYLDTMQVWVMYGQDPGLEFQKLATIKSNDSAGVPLSTNTWKQYAFVLSAFAGQQVCIAFRYYMNTTVDGLWCNIDDVFVGNKSSVGISQIGSNVPKSFALNQNYPNPFNPVTKIRFDIAKPTNVKMEVYNNLGQLVKTLFNEHKNAGYYETDFNASDLPSGVYFYRLTTETFTDTKKMIVVK